MMRSSRSFSPRVCAIRSQQLPRDSIASSKTNKPASEFRAGRDSRLVVANGTWNRPGIRLFSNPEIEAAAFCERASVISPRI